MEKKICFIFVLVDIRYGDILDVIWVVFYVYVGVDGNKRYLERFYCIIKGIFFKSFCVIIGYLNYYRFVIC